MSRSNSVNSPSQPPSEPSATVRGFCERILRSGDLETKLAPPIDAAGQPLPDNPAGPALEIDGPTRSPGLQMGPGGDALPKPGELASVAGRQLCLARFAHHELQAVEYFAWALLRWPDAPEALRRGLLSALADEQIHCRLYLDRLAAQGGRFDTDDHSDYFWRQAEAFAEAPSGIAAFLSGMGLTLEQANLDFTLTYRDAFAEAGDDESARVCQRVHDDEVAHVAMAARWVTRLSEDSDSDLACYLETVPFPLGPSRAKGKRFEVAPRKRAGLSDALIEHVRDARGYEPALEPIDVFPNLGGEESEAGLAYRKHGAVRIAAHLYSLLFPRSARLHLTDPEASGDEFASFRSQSEFWPTQFGRPQTKAAFDFLESDAHRYAWLNTEAAARANDASEPSLPLFGPSPDIVRAHHDKAFAVLAAEELGLTPRALEPCLHIIDPDALRDPDTLVANLEARLATWPEWTGRRWTLKPRFGSSGRGRIGGTDTIDSPKLRGSLPRLAAGGGAIFEPWLERSSDLSIALVIPEDPHEPVHLLGSLELWTSASGVYQGHCGEVDSRGRVFSGDREDEALRGDAAIVAARARAAGFFGPCGIDAFRYNAAEFPDGEPVERLRSLVEWNARMTMGIVTIGLVRRALPRVRKRLALSPGDRHGFALAYRTSDDREFNRRIYESVGNEAVILDLRDCSDPGDPVAVLVFDRDPEAIRAARKTGFGC